MERLTIKNWRNLDPWETCGQDNYCKRGCHEQGGCANGCIIPRIYAHLAVYEETGLEPEEIKDNMEMFRAYRHICAGHDPEHIRDLLQAENEGRLVVLPCKVGDTVFRVFTVGTREPIIKEVVIKTVGEAADLIGRIGKKNMLVSVFRTREEAETALKGGEG